MIIIPKPDHRLGKLVLIAERAQARRSQEKMPAYWSRTERQPARGKHSNEVSAGKEQYDSRNCADTLDHTVRPLASRTAVSEQLPVWAFRKYLGRAPPFILTIVPFHQVRISFGHGAKPGQFTGSGRALQRAGKHPGKCHALEALSEPPGVALAIWSQR